ncbi:MAG TPA: hypothetical protein VKC66_28400 [Xanthobacteraceae bacterium]|nr:hypothetical protein [Xanthobacteraceae bacterium]
MRVALLAAVFGAGLLAAPAAPYNMPARAPAELQAAWTEFKWPFPVDQWGIGRAFVCKPAQCGVEVKVYLRPKVGFCKCATGVDDDDELERVGDSALIDADALALGPGHVIEVAWMKGRSRPYRVTDPAQGRILSIGFNDECDVIVALATLGAGDREVLEPAVLAFLNSERVLRWVKWLLL